MTLKVTREEVPVFDRPCITSY